MEPPGTGCSKLMGRTAGSGSGPFSWVKGRWVSQETGVRLLEEQEWTLVQGLGLSEFKRNCWSFCAGEGLW